MSASIDGGRADLQSLAVRPQHLLGLRVAKTQR